MINNAEMALKTWLSLNRMGISLFLSIALQLAEWTQRQHAQGRLLYSVRPDRIYIQIHEGEPLLRFEAVRTASAEEGRGRQRFAERAEGEALETLAYISPEQTGLLQRAVDERSDLYGIGLLFYELLAGSHPFQARSAGEWMHAHVALVPTPPQTLNPAVPTVIGELVMKLLSKSPDQRYQSAYGLYDDLRQCALRYREKGAIDPFPLGEVDDLTRFCLPEQLCGREAEWQELLGAYERVQAGAMALLLIGGGAGNGKTSFVQALRKPVQQDNGYFISGKCDPLHSSPYASLIAAFRELVRQWLGESEDRVRFWRSRLHKALGRNGRLLVDVMEELALIIDRQPPVEELPPSAATHRFQTLFGRLIGTVADPERPLVLWLDDLQWADAATLELLHVLWQDSALSHVLLIGTYRDNELDEGHRLARLFLNNKEERRSGALQQIRIGSLGYPHVVNYVAETLHSAPDVVRPLAEALYRRTGGNPFYLKQLLQRCYDERAIRFDTDAGGWSWQLPAVLDGGAFEDVTSLIVSRFQPLPEATHRALRLASCCGGAFDIALLSPLYDEGKEQMAEALIPALNEGLLMASEQGVYTFLHDQVQQAAYGLIPPAEKRRLHFMIGNQLLLLHQMDSTDARLFETVHHFNLCIEDLAKPAERRHLALLNLQAGKKAKARAAYAQALALLETGAELLGGEGWSGAPELYFQMLLESSECLYFCGRFAQAEAVLAELKQKATQPAERARIYVIQISMYAFQNRENQAGRIALQAMAEFGLKVPSRVSSLIVLAEIGRTQLWLSRNEHRLDRLPASQEPMHKALADIVTASASILFILDEQLFTVMFARYVRMSLLHGASEALAMALGSYAIAVCFGLRGYETALRLIDLALRSAGQMDSVALKGKISFMAAFIYQFLKPGEAEWYYMQSEQACLESGDMIYAGYAISSRLITDVGDLRRLRRICEHYALQGTQALDEMTRRTIVLTTRYVQLLQGETDAGGRLKARESFNERELLKESVENNTDRSHHLYYYTCRMEILYLLGEYEEALACAERGKPFDGAQTLSFVQRFTFYYALSLAARYKEAQAKTRREYRGAFRRLMARMKHWSRVVPESARAKYVILQAEAARLEGKTALALDLYDQSARLAKQYGYPQDEAIASELAAGLLLSLQRPALAMGFLLIACQAYGKWGANGKVDSLRKRYPSLRTQMPGEATASASGEAGKTGEEGEATGWSDGADQPRQLDMETLRKAARLLPEGAGRQELLLAFLDLAIHYAGAERGIMLAEKDGKWTVEAEQQMNADTSSEDGQDASFAASIVQFVLRTQEPVVEGTAERGVFASDPYVRSHRLQSVLCLPLRYPDQQAGALYLENNLTSDAFTAGRLDVLEMAFSQMVYAKQWPSPSAVRLTNAESADVSAPEAARPGILPELIESLSQRELDVLRLMADGLSNKEIAIRLSISEGTVKSHAFNIYGKLQVNRRVQAVSRARELQLLK